MDGGRERGNRSRVGRNELSEARPERVAPEDGNLGTQTMTERVRG